MATQDSGRDGSIRLLGRASIRCSPELTPARQLPGQPVAQPCRFSSQEVHSDAFDLEGLIHILLKIHSICRGRHGSLVPKSPPPILCRPNISRQNPKFHRPAVAHKAQVLQLDRTGRSTPTVDVRTPKGVREALSELELQNRATNVCLELGAKRLFDRLVMLDARAGQENRNLQ